MTNEEIKEYVKNFCSGCDVIENEYFSEETCKKCKDRDFAESVTRLVNEAENDKVASFEIQLTDEQAEKWEELLNQVCGGESKRKSLAFANKILNEAFKERNKYRWHDLRKDRTRLDRMKEVFPNLNEKIIIENLCPVWLGFNEKETDCELLENCIRCWMKLDDYPEDGEK